MNRGTTQVLITGRAQGELALCLASLAKRPEVSVVEVADLPSAAVWLIAQEISPALIVLLQTRPGEVPAAEVERLRRLAPFSRIVGLLGSWCEGETRSGHPWLAVERIYWHQWPAWIARELQSLHEGTCGTWRLPVTAAPEERLLTILAHYKGSEASGAVGVCSPCREVAELLLDALSRAGHRGIRIDPACSERADVAIALWDSDSLTIAEASQLRACVAALHPAPVIALLSFPRREACERALAAGAAHVVSKPLLLNDLLAWETATRYAGAKY